MPLATAVFYRELGEGEAMVTDTGKDSLLVVNVLNIRGNATEHTGIETSKSPRLVGIQHHRGPQKAKGAAWGPGRGRGAWPLHNTSATMQPNWLLGLSQAAAQRPLGRYWLQAST